MLLRSFQSPFFSARFYTFLLLLFLRVLLVVCRVQLGNLGAPGTRTHRSSQLGLVRLSKRPGPTPNPLGFAMLSGSLIGGQ